MVAALILLALLCSGPSYAERGPTRALSDLVDPVPEPVYRVKTARVVLADYPLIRQDFEKTRAMSDAQIDEWLLLHAGYISKPQAAQKRVNSLIEIPRDENGKALPPSEAYRPQLYGRALVFKADEGLIDVKGAGRGVSPSLSDHSSGLASLGEAIREFIFQKKVQQLLDHGGSGLNTIKNYAVIDWGFDALEYDVASNTMKNTPAGAVLRQGHSRQQLSGLGNHFASPAESSLVEQMLRNYGITTTGDVANIKVDSTNVQISKTHDLVDFGGFLVKDRFELPVATYLGAPLLEKDALVQPNQALQLPLNIWGSTESGRISPRFDNLWIWSHKIAGELRSGQAKLEHLRQHWENFMKAGEPPESMRGHFKHWLSEERIAAEEDRLFLSSLKNNPDWIDKEAFAKYMNRHNGEIPPLARKNLQAELTKGYSNLADFWKILLDAQAFARNPALEDSILLHSAPLIHDEKVIESLVNRGRIDLLKEMLTKERFGKSLVETAQLALSRKKSDSLAFKPQNFCEENYSKLAIE